MKYYLMAGAVVLAGLVATMMAHQDPSSEYSEAKRNAVEPQNLNRPAHYQDMLFQSEAQLRAPANDPKKK